MPELAALAEVVRSGFVESVHFGSAVGLRPPGAPRWRSGRVDAPVLPRSSAKPFQALACLAAGAALDGPRLAIAAGSHTGEDFHVRLVGELLGATRARLRRAGLPGVAGRRTRPPGDALIRRGQGPSRERMNCSGKHAAMLAAAVANGWDTASYLDARPPRAAGGPARRPRSCRGRRPPTSRWTAAARRCSGSR